MISINTSQPCIGFAETRQGGRAENQDTCAYSETPLGLLVTVCDGMGGGPSGKLASTIAARNIIATLMACQPGDDRRAMLRQAVLNANAALYAQMEADPATRGMGTTVTALLLNAHSAVVAHVGDSRIYQLHGSKKKWRTFDHSMVFQMVKSGAMTEEQARTSANSNIILRALGHSPELQVDVEELSYRKGDRFMLCSDGIWGMFPEPEILKIVARNPGLGEAVESLVVKVDAAGVAEGNHHDNLTVAMVEMQADSELRPAAPHRPWLKWVMGALAAVCVLSVLVNVYLLHRAHNEPLTPPAEAQELRGETTRMINTDTTVRHDTIATSPKVAVEAPATAETPATTKAEPRSLDAKDFGIKADPKPAAKKAEPAKKTEPAKKAEAAKPAEEKKATAEPKTEKPAEKPATPADTTKK